MKNFTGFKYQESVLKTVKEPPIKKKFNWDRFSFFLLLIFGLLYFGYSYYQRIAYTSINGLVLLEKTAVNFTDDIRLMKIYTKEAEEIHQGDTLFVYSYEDPNNSIVAGTDPKLDLKARISGGNNERSFLKDKMNLKRQIAIKETDIEGYKAALLAKEMEQEEQKKQVLMGVDVAHKLPAIKSDIIELKTDIVSGKRELKILKKHLYALRSAERKLNKMALETLNQEQAISKTNASNIRRYYVSPIAGVIGQINNSPNEVCYKSENVMVIHQLENLKIKAYFETKAIGSAQIGDEVDVEFPDGTLGKGIIDNFYISTYEMPPEFQKKYEPTERSVLADIVPLNSEEAKHWIGYYKMAVVIRKKNTFNYNILGLDRIWDTLKE